jgi:putative flippase GtrA
VGVGNATVDVSIFTVLVTVFGLRDGIEPVIASVVGFIGGASHSYFWNSRVTFRGARGHGSPRVFAQFFSVAAGGALVSALGFSAVRAVWPDESTTLAVSKLGAIGAALIWDFSLMRAWVFPHRGVSQPPEAS